MVIILTAKGCTLVKPIRQNEREALPARLRCPWRAEHGAITLDLSPAAGPQVGRETKKGKTDGQTRERGREESGARDGPKWPAAGKG